MCDPCRHWPNACYYFAMELIRAALHVPPTELVTIPILVERRQLAKRLWRATAADGTEFGFELSAPLEHGDTVFIAGEARYVIRQDIEPVLEIPLPPAPYAAAVVGWAVGNLHFPIEAQPYRLLAPDDIALRQSLDRMEIAYRPTTEVFRPHRLAAGTTPHDHNAAAAAHPFVFRTVAPRA